MINYEFGQEVNGLTFIKEVTGHRSPSRITRAAIFKCSCGKPFETLIASVVSGNTKSCGCYGYDSRAARFTVHGLRNHPVYSLWCGIKTRCYNKNRADYKYYGGVGVVLSKEFHDFVTFYEYVTTIPNYINRDVLKLTIDRIDATKNYERGNIRWATRKQQSLNQRRNSGY